MNNIQPGDLVTLSPNAKWLDIHLGAYRVVSYLSGYGACPNGILYKSTSNIIHNISLVSPKYEAFRKDPVNICVHALCLTLKEGHIDMIVDSHTQTIQGGTYICVQLPGRRIAWYYHENLVRLDYYDDKCK